MDNVKIKINETPCIDYFDLFEVLDMKTNEIKHTAILSWLFDYKESHGVESTILKSFLEELFEDEYNSQRIGLLPEQIQLEDYKILRELNTFKGIFDLLIVSEKTKTVILIENKINAPAGKDQLDRYKSFLEEYYPNFSRILIFLTLKNTDPRTDGYLKANYGMLYQVLRKNLGHFETEELRNFIEQYMYLLRDLDSTFNQKGKK